MAISGVLHAAHPHLVYNCYATANMNRSQAVGVAPRNSLGVVILTKDEEVHLDRAIASLAGLAADIFVVDSGSTDRTLEIAAKNGATILTNPWVNHATQFNWALDRISANYSWIMRLDADEVVTRSLIEEIGRVLERDAPGVSAYSCGRRIAFLGKPIRWGGVFPISVVRLFRSSKGRCEDRWMDEHIVVDGPVHRLRGEILDWNLKPLTWWVEKHNHYASREAVEILAAGKGFLQSESVSSQVHGAAGRKRWLKENVFNRMPLGLRAWVFFTYRYVVRLGFLDGPRGARFHFLQALWYRYLVDAKVAEVSDYMCAKGVDEVTAIKALFGISLRPSGGSTGR